MMPYFTQNSTSTY